MFIIILSLFPVLFLFLLGGGGSGDPRPWLDDAHQFFLDESLFFFSCYSFGVELGSGDGVLDGSGFGFGVEGGFFDASGVSTRGEEGRLAASYP